MLIRPLRETSRRPVFVGVVMGALGLVTLVAWALASAPGSTPDDNYHLASIWCAGGDSPDCADDPANPQNMAPPNEVSGAPCFSQNKDASAACQNEFATDIQPGGFHHLGNWNTRQYPPLFYATMNKFVVTGELYSSVVMMRIFNGALLVGLMGLIAAGLPRRLRALSVVPVVVTSVPLGLTLLASTNPSSWTITGGAALWLSLYGAFETRGRPRVLLFAAALLAVLLAAGSRGDGALFSVMAVGMVLLMRFKEIKANLIVLPVAGLVGLIAVIFFVTSGHADVLATGGFGGGEDEPLPWHQVAIANLQELPNLWVGSLGFGFMSSAGWFDTPFPALVGFSATLVWAVLVFGGWREMYVSKTFAVIGIGAAMVVYPLVMLGLSGLYVGDGFQPRYLLPLLVVLTGVSLLSRTVVSGRLTMFQSVTVAVALASAQAMALHTQIRRYVTGLDEAGWSLDRGREWWWDIPISATMVWLAGSLAFGALCWLLVSTGALTGGGAQADPEASSSETTEDQLLAVRA